jgi:sulfur-carrier protein
MKVRLFAALREMAGASWVDVADAPDVGTLVAVLARRYGPRFEAIMASGTVVVNGRTAGHGDALGPQDEVALLPPVSGGRGAYTARSPRGG